MWCFARTDRADPVLLEKMKQAGINWVFMGVEAGNDEVLEGVSKRQDVKQVRTAVQNVREAGINVGACYVFGLSGDTHESMKQTLDFAKELNCDWANLFVSMAYPGTKLYEDALRERPESLPQRWEQYGFFAPNSKPLPTKSLSSEDILRFRDHAFQEYFTGARYQDMIERKFGPETRGFIQRMLTKKINRLYEQNENGQHIEVQEKARN